MRLATAVAGGLVAAAAVMAVLAFATGDDGTEPAARPAVTTTAGAGNRAGLAVWATNGCGSCHTLAAANATGRIGPDLGASLQGASAAAIRRSIVAPDDNIASGYSGETMPGDYGTRIEPGDLDRLVGFLRASAAS